MKTIALVTKNKCYFDKMEEFAMPLLYKEHSDEERKLLNQKINDYIWAIIEPYIKFIEVSDEELLTVACQSLTSDFPERKPDEFFYHTKSSYSFPKKYIEFIHCQPVWKGYEEEADNINNIGCLMSLDHSVIENKCIVIANKYDLTAPYFARIDSITKEDFIKIIRRRYFFSAVLIKNDSVVKYYYQNPRYLIMKVYGLNENDKIERLPLCHLKYNLLFFFQYDKAKYVNKIATRINGLYRMYGDVLLLHELEENIYANISLHEIKRLNVLSYGRLYDRQLKIEEIHTTKKIEVDKNGKEQEKKVTPYWSKYITIENRMNKWKENKNKCIYCNEEMVKPITCDKCFRVKYCSKKCQRDFSNYHDEECINPASL